MRVIFDRSSFHGERFNALVQSPLRHLVRLNRVRVFHTQVFLDETLATFGRTGPSGAWREHLAFVLEICNGGIFHDKDVIWHRELVEGRGIHARYLLSERRNRHGSQKKIVRRLTDVAESGNLRDEWAETQAERDEAHSKKMNQKKTARAIRDDISGALRDSRIKDGQLSETEFKHSREGAFVLAGRSLMKLVDKRRHATLADQWEASPSSYPYFTAFVEGTVYWLHYAAVEHNKRLDDNAQADYEQLAYLTWADVIVSDDTRFMRDAFNEIWKPRGKRLETSESFVALLQRLSSNPAPQVN
jgi:hypothetical protein